jgi:hypothetical protein
MSMISNSILDDLRMVGCGEGDDARQEDMRAASAAADEIKRLLAREARLQEALRPFNCVKGNWTHQPDDLPLTVAFGTDVRFSLTLGDFRRASAALGEEKK